VSDKDKTKEQLIDGLVGLYQRIRELETECKEMKRETGEHRNHLEELVDACIYELVTTNEQLQQDEVGCQ